MKFDKHLGEQLKKTQDLTNNFPPSTRKGCENKSCFLFLFLKIIFFQRNNKFKEKTRAEAKKGKERIVYFLQTFSLLNAFAPLEIKCC